MKKLQSNAMWDRLSLLLLALQMEERTMRQGMWAASRSKKGQGNSFPLEPLYHSLTNTHG